MKLTFDEWEQMRRVITGKFGENAAISLQEKIKIKYDSFIDPGTKERVFLQPYVMHRAVITNGKLKRDEWFAKFHELDTTRFVYVGGAASYLERKVNTIDPETGQRVIAPTRLYG